MTSVAERPLKVAPSLAATGDYVRFLSSGAMAIFTVSGFVAVWSVVAAITLSLPIGAIALLLAIGLAAFDARFATATRLNVAADGVTLGFWKREKTYAPGSVVVTHDVRRGRFTLTHRGSARRTLARFKDDAGAPVSAFLQAGIEILSQ
jgi:hypothetical protein